MENNNYQHYESHDMYQNPNQVNSNQNPYEEPMKIKDWLVTFLLLLIPIANIVLVFVWAFGSNVNKSKKTFFQAQLIFSGIILAFYLLIIILLIAAFSTFAFTNYI